MSFFSPKPLIEEGDLIILYLSPTQQYPILVKKFVKNKGGAVVENKFQTVYGLLNVISLVGKEYGTKFHLPKGWAYLLRPTCELWTKNLPHRTQIIYTPDISMIIMGLSLCPGAIVIEAGTGSGSLSHSIIRAIHPSGHLYTFDFHLDRADTAREEFKSHGLKDWVTVEHRDVIGQGFGVERKVDAVFLDLPSPWDVVPHLQNSLKRGGKLCTFSPCIEQVGKTVESLNASSSFILLQTMEVLQRPMSIQNRTLLSIDFSPELKGGDEKLLKHNPPPVQKHPVKFRTLTTPSQLPGHTGYLTFATFVPN